MNIQGEARRRLLVNGIVQGVGFRPFVYRIAVGLGLKGFIRNTPSGVLIEVQGSSLLLDSFCGALKRDCPPLARIEAMKESALDCVAEERFIIADSSAGADVETLIPPDIALCGDCRRELLDPANRRFRYPFINCTNCGPRYTIVDRLPYDHPSTSMHTFTMCPECEREYLDPLDRRTPGRHWAVHENDGREDRGTPVHTPGTSRKSALKSRDDRKADDQLWYIVGHNWCS